MAFRHGKATAIYMDSLDASPYFNSADNGRTLGTAEVTAFGAQGKAYIAGVEDSTINASGFFDGGVGAIDEKLWNLTAASVGSQATYPITYCPDGGAIVGRQARLMDVHNTNITPSSPIGGVVSLKMTGQVTGAVDWGKVLQGPAAITTATTITGTTVDWGANSASTAGGVANIHVITNTWSGATTIKVQHSTDNSVWTDLITQTVPAGVAIDLTHPYGQPTAYAPTIAGAVNRYVRAYITTAAGAGTITAVVAFARF